MTKIKKHLRNMGRLKFASQSLYCMKTTKVIREMGCVSFEIVTKCHIQYITMQYSTIIIAFFVYLY